MGLGSFRSNRRHIVLRGGQAVEHLKGCFVQINAERLLASLAEFACIGATPGGGVSRLALSDEDREARDLLRLRMEEAGMMVRVDDFGTMTGHRAAAEPGEAVVLGSHLDSVLRGGKYDGTYGVIAALEVVRALNDAGILTRLPIEVVNWTDEEGARFEPANTASGAFAGCFSRDFVYDRVDRDGLRFEDELRRVGYLGQETNRPGPAAAYLELHIEQGPVLEDAGLAVGVVEGVAGMTWTKVTVTGHANHVGTTPMPLRRDALAAAARLISGVEQLGRETPDAVSTVGRISVEPNNSGVIPGRVVFTVDFCHRYSATLDALVMKLQDLVVNTMEERGVDAQSEQIWWSSPAPFAPEMIDIVQDACTSVGADAMRLWSGAGHDAMYMQKVCPTGMIFIRSAGGLSHSEEEYSTPEDLEAGANVLLHAAIRLAQQVS
jgi:beta-ureidopropionase / N-carbamoyl-L-amino-acid hydrolase